VPSTPDELHAFVDRRLGLRVARGALTVGASAPFDYLVHTFFEGRFSAPCANPSPDCIVWANRGGGKTLLGAVATLLDVCFKPGVEVRIIGGSLEQAARMHGHLRRFFAKPEFEALLDAEATEKRVVLKNGARAEILAQSQTSIRGTRVQKVRCDEADLFDFEAWEAAQLTTRSLELPGPWGPTVRGGVEALSTMHRPYGLMWQLVGMGCGLPPAAGAGRGGGVGGGGDGADGVPPPRRTFRWGLIDTLAHCGEGHQCGGCALEVDCRGLAKTRPPEAAGHVTIEDALRQQARVSRSAWEAEMLCLRPRREEAVYPEFEPTRHVFLEGSDEDRAAAGDVLVCGMDFGFRSPTVVLWATVDRAGTLRVLDERVVSGARLESHVEAISAGRWHPPEWVGCDPAGGAANEHTGKTNIQMLKQADLKVRNLRLPIREGCALVRARLAPADPKAAPTLRVSSRCRGLIEALHRYHYDPERPFSEEPVKDGPDHAADALRYLVINLDHHHHAKRLVYA
jgi:hypothetical protein